MDATTEPAHTLNSRWTREPCVRGGQKQRLELQPRDIAILRLMSRYAFLPGDYIHAFVGGSRKIVLDRLGRMIRKPYCYLNRPTWQRSKLNPNYRRTIYELDDAGARLIGTELPRVHGNHDHELMACCIRASFELGARDTEGVRLISWDEIIGHTNFPRATHNADTMHGLPVSLSFEGERVERYIVADCKPFGIERTIDGKKSYFFFPGIEADCNTEPVFTSNYKRSSIYLKLAAYLVAIEQDIHRKRWGVPNLYVPIITTGEEHKRSMMRLLDRMTDSKGSRHILFGVMPGFTFLERPPPPTSRMLTQPWDRVGYPPLDLLK
jgi:hypothetical protein